MGSGTILREVLAASKLLMDDFGIPSDVWSVTSFNELRREALETERWNNLHPEEPKRKNYIQQCLAKRSGPYIAATDYMKIVPDQIQRWVPGRFISLGTDGFGRSDGRAALRDHFRGRQALHRGHRIAGARRGRCAGRQDRQPGNRKIRYRPQQARPGDPVSGLKGSV